MASTKKRTGGKKTNRPRILEHLPKPSHALANLRLFQAGVAKHDPCSFWVFQEVPGNSINADLPRRRGGDQALFAHPIFRPHDDMRSSTIPGHFYGLTQKFVDRLKKRQAARGILAPYPAQIPFIHPARNEFRQDLLLKRRSVPIA
jgi:hypothetical protein